MNLTGSGSSKRSPERQAQLDGILESLQRAAETARRRAAANGTKLAFFKDGKVVLEDPYPEESAEHKPCADAQSSVEREASYANG